MSCCSFRKLWLSMVLGFRGLGVLECCVKLSGMIVGSYTNPQHTGNRVIAQRQKIWSDASRSSHFLICIRMVFESREAWNMKYQVLMASPLGLLVHLVTSSCYMCPITTHSYLNHSGKLLSFLFHMIHQTGHLHNITYLPRA